MDLIISNLRSPHPPLQAAAHSSASPHTATSRASRSSSCSGPRSWPAARGSACAAGAWPSRASRWAWPGWASGGWSNEDVGRKLGFFDKSSPLRFMQWRGLLGWDAGRLMPCRVAQSRAWLPTPSAPSAGALQQEGRSGRGTALRAGRPPDHLCGRRGGAASTM